MRSYTAVEPTLAEILKYTRRKGYAPAVGMVACDHCGKRIWNSGLGRGAHNRAKSCALRNWANGKTDTHPDSAPTEPTKASKSWGAVFVATTAKDMPAPIVSTKMTISGSNLLHWGNDEHTACGHAGHAVGNGITGPWCTTCHVVANIETCGEIAI